MRQFTTCRAATNVHPIWPVLAILPAFAFFAAAPSASAQECEPIETHKLLASDGAEGDYFGRSVAISGTTAIIGAPYHDDSGIFSGSAYLFDTATGQQIVKLLPSDGAEDDRFGESVAISGSTAIVGAPRDNDNGTNSGSAYLFDTTTGQQIAKLVPSDGAPIDLFGISVAIDRTTAIVGAYRDGDNGLLSGSAYLFDTTTGQQIAKLLASDGAQGDYFGISVAISGTTAVVGAYHDDENGYFSGSAYLFDTTTGQQIAKLLPSDGAEYDRFGNSVAISGTTAIVGAWGWGEDDSGSAYLFDTTTGRQIAKLLPIDGEDFDHFGYSVAISGTTAIVGAIWDADNGVESGSAYLFDVATGTQMAKLLASDGAQGDLFGRSVAINATVAIVGADGDDDNGDNSGSAYVFDDVNCTGPSLRIVGRCPGRMGFEASGVTPGGQVAFLSATGEGSVTIPAGNPCAGTTLGLNTTVRLGTVVRADAKGVATVIASIPAQACGKIFVQALDVESCATSNVAPIE